ncbi:MAG: polymer-forming cytoskeletal protein [Magnetospirillum sp.]|nr:polymer-forming cytoskeletal protein [Magnetospirillum sp.]
MLQKFVKTVSSSGGSNQGGVLSVIGPDVRIVGDILSQGELHVDGQVEGDITCTTLVVGEGARISGEVTAEHTKIFGELKGKINAAVVTIARSARVLGDVAHEVLEIEAGAFVEGQCIHRASAPKRLEAPPPQTGSEGAKSNKGAVAAENPA